MSSRFCPILLWVICGLLFQTEAWGQTATVYSRSSGANFNWNTTDAIWTVGGVENQPWVNAETNALTGIELTTTAATTVTLADGIVTDSIKLVSGTSALTFTGGTLSFLGSATIDVSVIGTGTSPNIASKITGTIPSGELTIYGIGNTSNNGGGNGSNTQLSNTGNDFVGNVRIKSGIVLANTDSSFGNTSNKIILDGGGLVYSANTTSTRDILVGTGGGLIRTYGNTTTTVGSIADEATGKTGTLRHTDGGTLQVTNNFDGFSGTFKQEYGALLLGDGSTSAPSVNGVFPSKVNMSGGTTRLNYKGELNFASNSFTATGGNLEIYGDSTTKVNLNNQGTISLGSFAIRTAEVNVGSGTTIDISGQFRTGDYTSCPTVLNIDGGTINANGTSNTVSNAASVLWGHWGSGATSTVNLISGAFNSPNANILLGWDSDSTFKISGGTATVRGIDLNSARSNASTVTLTGGILNIGVGGIVNSNGTNKTVNFGAGTVGATTDWTASGPINLTDETTGTTFATNFHTITLAGAIGGMGKVNVTGGGTLEIGSATVLGNRAVSVAANSTISFSSTAENTIDPAKMTIAGRLNVNDGANVATVGSVSVGGWSTNNSLFQTQDGAAMTVSGTDLANSAVVTVSGGGTLNLTSTPLQQAPNSSSMKLRLDASTITGVESGSAITSWADTSGNGNNAQIQDSGSRGDIVYQVDASTGLPSVVFNSNGQTSFGFNRISDIRTVFWVAKDGSTYNQSFLLGDRTAYHFHRGSNGELFNANSSANVRGGTITLNGENVTASATLNQGNWDLLSLVTTGNVQANQLSKDRDANNFSGGMATRSWDGSISEVIIFNEALSAEQVQEINAYLNQKWNLGLTGDYFQRDFISPNTSLVLTDDTTVNAAYYANVELKELVVADGKTATIVQNAGTVWNVSNIQGNIVSQNSSGNPMVFKVEGTIMDIAGADTTGTAAFTAPVDISGNAINFDVTGTGDNPFDVLSSTSTIDLTDDVISIIFGAAYTPQLGDSFDIITSDIENGITGFDSIQFIFDTSRINMIPDTSWYAALSADGKTLSIEMAVPEPSTWALLILGAAGLMLFRRRK